MNRGKQFKLVSITVLLALVWLPVKASAAQCGGTAAGGRAAHPRAERGGGAASGDR
jgi:hypothetical protein